MILTVSEVEFVKMRRVFLDKDTDVALELIKVFAKRLEHQSQRRFKSHLEGS